MGAGTRVEQDGSPRAHHNGMQLPPSVFLLIAWLGTWLAFALAFRHPAMPERMGGWNGFDYRDTFYVPIRDLMHGHMPWDLHGYHHRHPASQMVPLYLPSYWLVAMPFMLLPYRVGLFGWLGLLAAAAVALAVFTVRWFVPTATRARHLAALVTVLLLAVATPPLRSGILATNWAPVSAVAAIAAAWLSVAWTPWPTDRRRRAALVALTCLAIVKPQVGIPLLLVQLCLGAWRVAAVAWGISLVAAAPIGVLAWHASGSLSHMVSLFRETVSQGEGLPLSDPSSTRVDLLGALGHLSVHPGGVLSLTWELVVLALCLASLVLALRAHRRGIQGSDALLVASMGLTLLLVAPNLLYAAPVLVPAIAALTEQLWRAVHHTGRVPLGPAALWALLVFPFVNLRSLAFHLGYSPTLTNALNGFDLNLAAVVLLGLLLRHGGSRGGRRA